MLVTRVVNARFAKSVAPVCAAERSVFCHSHFRDPGSRLQRRPDTLENEPGEILPGGNELSIRELGNVLVDVSVIKAIMNLAFQNAVENREVHGHAREWVDVPAHGHVTRVRMTVKVGSSTQAKGARVLLVAPFRTPIPMRSGERDPACQEGSRHPRKLVIFSGDSAARGAFETFLRRRFWWNPGRAVGDSPSDIRGSVQTPVEVLLQRFRFGTQWHRPIPKQ